MPLLTATGIKKLFGGVVALSNGNLTCEEGKITGLLGTNGSGKSTISKIITGVYSKDGGNIIYDGKEINFRNPNEAKMHGISMVFQNLSLLPDLTVWQNIVLGIEEKNGLFLDNKKAERFLAQPKDYGKPWFGQLMAGPQMLAYFLQVNDWMEMYGIS